MNNTDIQSTNFIPSRLIEARELKGMTRKALAEQLEISPTTLSNYEMGRTVPTGNIDELSSALDVPSGFFYLTGREERSYGAPFFRNAISARTKKSHTSLKRFTKIAYDQIDWIGRDIEFPEFNLPQSEKDIEDSSFDMDFIEKMAKETRTALGVGDGPVLNLCALLENHGVLVIRNHSLDGHKYDGFNQIINNRPLVILSSKNKTHTYFRERYSLAHELAHIVLHSHLQEEEALNPKKLKLIEKQANDFAGAFLLPKVSIIRDVGKLTLQNLIPVKSRWRVSIAAIIMRLYSLGLIDDDRKTSLMKQLSFQGWRTREPLDAEYKPEQPTYLAKAWDMITTHGLRSVDEIETDLRHSLGWFASTLSISLKELRGDIIIQFSNHIAK